MKIKFALYAAALTGAAALNAATLSVATAVQSQPDAASAVIIVLPAGAEQPTPTDKAALPLIAIPTTAGTGAEVSAIAQLMRERQWKTNVFTGPDFQRLGRGQALIFA